MKFQLSLAPTELAPFEKETSVWGIHLTGLDVG